MRGAGTPVGRWMLAAVALCLAVGGPARAEKARGGGGDGATSTVLVWAVNPEGTVYSAPTYLPPCAARKAGGKANYGAVFDRHDLCATLTTSTGAELTDDLVLQVTTTKGYITSIQVRGQDVIGEEGIQHESEVWPITPPAGGFTLHVHADDLPVWKLSGHLGGDRVEIVGYVSIGDLVYAPQP